MNQQTKILPIIMSLLLGLICIIGNPFESEAYRREKEKRLPRGMMALYEENRTRGIPNYITEDFMLLSYSMILNETITDLEEAILYPEFRNLIKVLRVTLKGQATKVAVNKANLDFLYVLASLLEGAELPYDGEPDDLKIVKSELEKIDKAEGFDRSPLMKQRIDYSQFKVRGKYTRSRSLGSYFKAMKYAGAVLFPVVESKATGITAKDADFLTRQALILTRVIQEDNNLLNIYNNIEERLGWLFGPPDDLLFADYHEIGKNMKDKAVHKIRESLFDRAVKMDRQPAIISGAVDVKALEKGVLAKDVMTGWRFMPQRFTPDSGAFQQLVYDNVKKYMGKKQPFSGVNINNTFVKGYPLGLEMMALLGSKAAINLLDGTDERNFHGYSKAADAAKAVFLRPSGLAFDHIQLMNYWLTRGKIFHKDDEKRRLNTCLSFWTYQRYINLLYAKQSYTVVTKSFREPVSRNWAWIEPAPELYLYIQNQVQELISKLNSGQEKGNGQNVANKMIERLENFFVIVKQCRHIAVKELLGATLDIEDVNFLNELDARIAYLTITKDLPIVVDVHTEPNSAKVLEEGIGYPQVVIFKMGNQEARGALFTYYEFKHPMEDRLTDEKWLLMLSDSEVMEKLDLSPGSTGTSYK